jgi:hypothetical protein
MKFPLEGPISEQFRPIIRSLSEAVKAGWPSAALSEAFIHVGRDVQHRDVIYFDIRDSLGREATSECALDEQPTDVKRMAQRHGGRWCRTTLTWGNPMTLIPAPNELKRQSSAENKWQRYNHNLLTVSLLQHKHNQKPALIRTRSMVRIHSGPL